MENIYADSGNIIFSGRYIHRTDNERTVCSRLLDNESYGSVGLVGMQRVGKSSIAYNTIIRHKEELLKRQILVIDLVMYNYKSPQAFFTAIAEKAYDVLDDLDLIQPKLERRYKRAMETDVEETGGERIRAFFRTVVTDLGYRVVYGLIREGNTMKVIIISIRDDEAVYREAERRITNMSK